MLTSLFVTLSRSIRPHQQFSIRLSAMGRRLRAGSKAVRFCETVSVRDCKKQQLLAGIQRRYQRQVSTGCRIEAREHCTARPVRRRAAGTRRACVRARRRNQSSCFLTTPITYHDPLQPNHAHIQLAAEDQLLCLSSRSGRSTHSCRLGAAPRARHFQRSDQRRSCTYDLRIARQFHHAISAR